MNAQPRHLSDSPSTDDDGPYHGVLGAFHRCQKGTSLTEFVITLPVFLVVLSGLLTFQDVLMRLTLTEVRAYQETANATMEVQRTGVMEADGDPDLRHHLEHETAAGFTSDQLSADDYPPIRPSAALNFESSFRSQMTDSHTSFDQALGNNAWAYGPFSQAPDKLRPLFDAGVDNEMMVRNRLFGSNRSAAYNLPDGDYLRRGHLGTLDGDLFYGELMDGAEDFIQNQSSINAATMGTRYGVLARHATHEYVATDPQPGFMRVGYSLDYGSYYSSGAPMAVDVGAGEKKNRATVVSRIMMRGSKYDKVLRFGTRADDFDPAAPACASRLCDLELEPDEGSDLFDGPLLY